MGLAVLLNGCTMMEGDWFEGGPGWGNSESQRTKYYERRGYDTRSARKYAVEDQMLDDLSGRR